MNELERNEGLTTAELAARPAGSTDEIRKVEEARRFQPHQQPQAMEQAEVMEPLFAQDELTRLRSRWKEIQGGFVDEPRRAVQEADQHVAHAIKHLADSFADARSKLEAEWARGADVSTEDLRLALRRYRSFFDRLLAI